MTRKFRTHNPDYVFIASVFFLTLFGLVILSSASSEIGKARFDDTYFYLKHQIINGLLMGIIGFVTAYKLPLKLIRKLSTPLFFLTIISLILVFTPLGFTAGGATRWIVIGGVSIQPAEILKFTFMLYLAAWISSDLRGRTKSLKGFIPFLVLCGFVGALLLLQPTTSTAVIILASSLVMYFTGGGKISYATIAVVLGLAILISVIYFTPYRWQRLVNYFNPEADPLGGGFQRNQALIALGSGKIFGVGYGNSISKFNYLPEPISDSIFAIIGEEFGFAGTALLISAFMVLIIRIFKIAHSAPDTFTKLLIIGIVSIVAIQTFVNIAAISGLLPLTGVPLPFISFGGTAIGVLLVSMGTIANISRYT